MHQQFRIFGIILLAFGIIGVVTMIAAFFFFGLAVYLSGDMAHELGISFVDYYVSAIVLLATIDSILQLIAGIGLIKHRPWARSVTIIASIISLPGFPFFTVLGIYGLWLMYSTDGVCAWNEYLSRSDIPAVKIV